MRVILEGPDNAGKSSLARAIRMEVCNVKYFHPGGAPATAIEEADCLATQDAMFMMNEQIIFDRVTCISQMVYNPNPDRDPVRRTYQKAMWQNPGTVVIYCRPPTETLMDVGNYTWRPEETEEHRQKIITRAYEFIERYDAVMLGVPTIFYDWKDQVHAGVVQRKLIQALNGRTDAQEWFRNILELRN